MSKVFEENVALSPTQKKERDYAEIRKMLLDTLKETLDQLRKHYDNELKNLVQYRSQSSDRVPQKMLLFSKKMFSKEMMYSA